MWQYAHLPWLSKLAYSRSVRKLTDHSLQRLRTSTVVRSDSTVNQRFRLMTARFDQESHVSTNHYSANRYRIYKIEKQFVKQYANNHHRTIRIASFDFPRRNMWPLFSSTIRDWAYSSDIRYDRFRDTYHCWPYPLAIRRISGHFSRKRPYRECSFNREQTGYCNIWDTVYTSPILSTRAASTAHRHRRLPFELRKRAENKC